MAQQTVTGEIRFDRDAPLFADATIYVRLQTVSQADAPAHNVAEQVIRQVSRKTHDSTQQPFELVCDAVNEKDAYHVQVLVDIDGDGAISVGDLITTQSYPVLTFGYPNHISVTLTEVR